MARILVADDEPGLREFLVDALEMAGHEVTAVADGARAIRSLRRTSFDVVVTDLNMPGTDGMEVVRAVCAEQPEVQVIVLTAHGTVATAVEAMKLGAYDFLQKPVASPEALAQVVDRALERRALLDGADRARRSVSVAPRLTHGDPAMVPVVDAIEKVASTAATVLLLGESGTGKEVAARAIHDLGDRAAKPFVALNCAALTETLLESELFGHEKGAFTGASERRRGRIELAAGGTFFLDEVGELRPELQAKLLRVIQERNFERIGGTQTIAADVRWIAATNRDLRQMIEAGSFREDLYHRIAVFPIRLPPLRERIGDLLPIAASLLEVICADLKRPTAGLTESAERKLAAWHWPGNVRELRNALERAAIMAGDEVIDADHLWLEASSGAPPGARPILTLAELERDAIERALEATDGNRRRAAELLGIGERTLYDRIKRMKK